jgi:hypothetical protein
MAGSSQILLSLQAASAGEAPHDLLQLELLLPLVLLLPQQGVLQLPADRVQIWAAQLQEPCVNQHIPL